MKLNFEVEFRESGMFVTSPQIPGLLVSSDTLAGALEGAAAGVNQLLLAAALQTAESGFAALVIQR